MAYSVIIEAAFISFSFLKYDVCKLITCFFKDLFLLSQRFKVKFAMNIEEMNKRIKQSCLMVMVTDLDEPKEKKKLQKGDCLGAPVVKTLCSHFRGCGVQSVMWGSIPD